MGRVSGAMVPLVMTRYLTSVFLPMQSAIAWGKFVEHVLQILAALSQVAHMLRLRLCIGMLLPVLDFMEFTFNPPPQFIGLVVAVAM